MPSPPAGEGRPAVTDKTNAVRRVTKAEIGDARGARYTIAEGEPA